MVENATTIDLTAGYITLTDSHGRATRHPIANVLRAADIPTGLTYSQVTAISTFLIRTLIYRGYLDQNFMDDNQYNLDAIIEVLENMGADYDQPDITTTPAV